MSMWPEMESRSSIVILRMFMEEGLRAILQRLVQPLWRTYSNVLPPFRLSQSGSSGDAFRLTMKTCGRAHHAQREYYMSQLGVVCIIYYVSRFWWETGCRSAMPMMNSGRPSMDPWMTLALMTRAHSFPQTVEFRAEPRNLGLYRGIEPRNSSFSAEFLQNLTFFI